MDTNHTPERLAAEIAALPTLPPIEQARRARALVDVAKSVLSAAGDAATYEACKGTTQVAVAEELGVSEGRVRAAIVRHKARVGA